jgi:hypothetical protein
MILSRSLYQYSTIELNFDLDVFFTCTFSDVLIYVKLYLKEHIGARDLNVNICFKCKKRKSTVVLSNVMTRFVTAGSYIKMVLCLTIVCIGFR